MDDAERVRLGDGLARLEHVVDRARHVERALFVDRLREVGALEVLHHHEGRAALERADIEHAGDVLALQLDGGPGLAREPADDLGVLEGIGEQELEGDELLELEVLGRDDQPHAALAEDVLDPVLAGEDVARRDG